MRHNNILFTTNTGRFFSRQLLTYQTCSFCFIFTMY